VTTVSRLNLPRERTMIWGIVLSVLIHGVLFLPGVQDMFKDWKLEIPDEVAVVPMEFTLVSPPDNPTPSNEISPYLSTVNSQASDMSDAEQESDLPHSEGRIPIVDTPARERGAEGGGESELPPLPEKTTDLGDAFKRSKFLDQMSPRRDMSMPDETPDFKNLGSVNATLGGISINTTAWDFAPYLLDLKQRVKQQWIPPLAFTALGAIHGYTVIYFRIYPDGRMDLLEVIEEEGHRSLHQSSANAIKGAAPFRRLPDHFPEPYLEVKFGFYYLLPGDEYRFFKNREQ
jgi:hypothetical protein